MDKLRDRIWMYGAVPSAYHVPQYSLPGVNSLDPAEACRRFGLTHAVMDVTIKGPFYPFDEESEKLSFLDELVWTIIPSGDVRRNEDNFFDMDEIIRQIKKYPNIKGVFCDDFLYRRRKLFSPDNLKTMKEKVLEGAGRPMDMWMVVYDYDLLTDAIPELTIWNYSDPVDVATFWTWHPFYLKVLEDHIDVLAKKWPTKKYNVGVYLWDFSTGKPLPDELMQLQLDTVLKLLREGKIDSISLCSNCIMGIGLETETIFRKWLDRYGDEEIAPAVRRADAGELIVNDRL